MPLGTGSIPRNTLPRPTVQKAKVIDGITGQVVQQPGPWLPGEYDEMSQRVMQPGHDALGRPLLPPGAFPIMRTAGAGGGGGGGLPSFGGMQHQKKMGVMDMMGTTTATESAAAGGGLDDFYRDQADAQGGPPNLKTSWGEDWPTSFPRKAEGTRSTPLPPLQPFIAGDSTDGKPNEELIIPTPQGTHVIPMDDLGSLPAMAMGTMDYGGMPHIGAGAGGSMRKLPHMAEGTVTMKGVEDSIAAARARGTELQTDIGRSIQGIDTAMASLAPGWQSSPELYPLEGFMEPSALPEVQPSPFNLAPPPQLTVPKPGSNWTPTPGLTTDFPDRPPRRSENDLTAPPLVDATVLPPIPSAAPSAASGWTRERLAQVASEQFRLGNLPETEANIAANQLRSGQDPNAVAQFLSQTFLGEQSRRAEARDRARNPQGITVGVTPRAPLEPLASPTALSPEEKQYARLERQLWRDAREDPRLRLALLEGRAQQQLAAARAEAEANRFRIQEAGRADVRSETARHNQAVEKGLMDRFNMAEATRAAKTAEEKRQEAADLTRKLYSNAVLATNLQMQGRLPADQALNLMTMTDPAAQEMLLKQGAFNTPAPQTHPLGVLSVPGAGPQPAGSALSPPGTGTVLKPQPGPLEWPGRPFQYPDLSKPAAGSATAGAQAFSTPPSGDPRDWEKVEVQMDAANGTGTRFAYLPKRQTAPAPEIKNFGTSDAPDWRQWDAASGSWKLAKLEGVASPVPNPDHATDFISRIVKKPATTP